MLPLLEIPGKTPTACPQPIITEVLRFIGLSISTFLLRLSAKRSSVAVIKKVKESNQILFSNKASKSNARVKIIPITPAGIVARTKYPNLLKGFLNNAQISFHKTIKTGIKVPICSITL